MTPMVRTASLVVLLALAAAPGTARADAKAGAKLRMERAAELHRAGNFAAAMNELAVAYTLDPQPEMLYGIGQLHVALGDCSQAILFYERFLSTRPDPVPAAAATEAIETCRTDPDSLKAGAASGAAPLAGSRPDEAPGDGPTRWYADKAGGALLGGGIVLGAIAVATYASARSDLDAAEAAPDAATHDELADRAGDKRTIAAVIGVAGIGLAGAAITRYVLVSRRAGTRAAVGIAPASGGGLVTWSARF